MARNVIMSSLCRNVTRAALPTSLGLRGSRRNIHLLPLPLNRSSAFNFHSSRRVLARPRKDFFSSSPATRNSQQQKEVTDNKDHVANSKRKSSRSTVAKTSLRRVAVEAQRSRDSKDPREKQAGGQQIESKVNSADHLMSLALTRFTDRDSCLCCREIQYRRHF